jgi:hypothetical protein
MASNITVPIRLSICYPAVAIVSVSMPAEVALELVKDGLDPIQLDWALNEAAQVLTTKGNAEVHVEISGEEALTCAVEESDDAIVEALRAELGTIEGLVA